MTEQEFLRPLSFEVVKEGNTLGIAMQKVTADISIKVEAVMIATCDFGIWITHEYIIHNGDTEHPHEFLRTCDFLEFWSELERLTILPVEEVGTIYVLDTDPQQTAE